jgi:hypothetical protein
MISFVPAPIAAPVSALTTLLVVVFVFVFVGVTVGFFTTEVGVVLVVGVVGVFAVTVGALGTLGLGKPVVGFVVVGFVETAGLVATDGFVVIGLVVVAVFVVAGLVVAAGLVVEVSVGFVIGNVDGDVIVDVTGRLTNEPVPDEVIEGRAPEPPEDVIELEPPEPPPDVMDEESLPVREGALFKLRMTLSNGARSRPLASGSCLLEVRFFRIAMFYPVFFTNEVKPAIFVTGLRFAVLANVLAGATVVGFLTGGAF